jgi:hypothetical protein
VIDENALARMIENDELGGAGSTYSSTSRR